MTKDFIMTLAHRFGGNVNYLLSVSYKEAVKLGYKFIYLKSNRVINNNHVKKLAESAIKNGCIFVHDALVLPADNLLKSIGEEAFKKLDLINADRNPVSDDEDLSKCLIVVDGQHRIQACIDNSELDINLLLAAIPEGMSIESFVRLYNSCCTRWSRVDFIDSHLETGELTNPMYRFSREIAKETDYSDKSAESLCTGVREGATLQDLIENTIDYVIYSPDKCESALDIAAVVRHLNNEDLNAKISKPSKTESKADKRARKEAKELVKKQKKVRKYFYTIDFVDILHKSHVTGGTEHDWAETVAAYLLSLTPEEYSALFTPIDKKNSTDVQNCFLKCFQKFLNDTDRKDAAMKAYHEAEITAISSPVK